MSEVVTIGGGCFWCLEAVFEQVRGVESVVSGYSAGHVENPSYEQVCTKTTGHAEVVQITFDPKVVSFEELLEIFFVIHDPTTPNRQGGDVGPQYRSIILYHDQDQKQTAERVIARFEADGIWSGIVTEVQPLEVFYAAEKYHQQYYQRNPNQGYCRMVVATKVAKLREKFLAKVK